MTVLEVKAKMLDAINATLDRDEPRCVRLQKRIDELEQVAMIQEEIANPEGFMR